MSDSTFVYVTYIRTTPERLWEALTTQEFIKRYWMGVKAESSWQVGSPWSLTLEDGRLADVGEITEAEPQKRLAIRWRNEFMPELKAEGWSLCTMELEPMGELVKLTLTHSQPKPDSKLIKAVSGGWPQILSSLKTLLETGEAFGRPQP